MVAENRRGINREDMADLLRAMSNDTIANIGRNRPNAAIANIINEGVDMGQAGSFSPTCGNNFGDGNIDALFSDVEFSESQKSVALVLDRRKERSIIAIDNAKTVQPSIQVGNARSLQLFHGRVHASAIGMAANKNVRHAQHAYSKLQYGFH